MPIGIPEGGFGFASISTVSVASASDVSVLKLCMQIMFPKLFFFVYMYEKIVGLNESRRLQNQS
jgi:hypothetical protein